MDHVVHIYTHRREALMSHFLCASARLTCSVDSSSRPSDIIVRLSIGQNYQEIFVGAISHMPKYIPGCVEKGISSSSTTAHVADSLKSGKNLLFRDIVCKAKLGALIISELYRCNFGTNICDFKCFSNITNKFKHETEVAVSNTAGTIYQESYVD